MNTSRVQNHKRFPQMFCELSTCRRSGSHYSNMRCLGFLKRQTQKILLHHLNAISFNKKRDKMKKKDVLCFGKCNAESLVKSCANTSAHKVTGLEHEQ